MFGRRLLLFRFLATVLSLVWKWNDKITWAAACFHPPPPKHSHINSYTVGTSSCRFKLLLCALSWSLWIICVYLCVCSLYIFTALMKVEVSAHSWEEGEDVQRSANETVFSHLFAQLHTEWVSKCVLVCVWVIPSIPIWINTCVSRLLSINVRAEYNQSPLPPHQAISPQPPPPQISAPAAPFTVNYLLYTKMRHAVAWEASQVSSLFPTSQPLVPAPPLFPFFFFFLPLISVLMSCGGDETRGRKEGGWLDVV